MAGSNHVYQKLLHGQAKNLSHVDVRKPHDNDWVLLLESLAQQATNFYNQGMPRWQSVFGRGDNHGMSPMDYYWLILDSQRLFVKLN
ncbi:hypothetical protein Tco_0499482 [Tanacetum coccineum]